MENTLLLSNLLSWIILPITIVALPSPEPPRLLRSLQHRQTPYLATDPVPQYIPQALSVASSKPAECKNCPWGSCINARAITPGTDLAFSCWTQGESVNNDRTWVRHNYGTRIGDFCYVSPFDMQQQSSEFYKSRLPYCGTKSELNFYLPRATTKTELFTECSLCPYRDCEGVDFYQAGVSLEVNCVVLDGWSQVSPTHETGTRKYYRTTENCYVSVSTVKELPLTPEKSEPLPACGPIPHLKLQDRPIAVDPSTTNTSTPESSNVTSEQQPQEPQQQQSQQAPMEPLLPQTSDFLMPLAAPAPSIAAPSQRPGRPNLTSEEEGEDSEGDSDDEDDGL